MKATTGYKIDSSIALNKRYKPILMRQAPRCDASNTFDSSMYKTKKCLKNKKIYIKSEDSSSSLAGKSFCDSSYRSPESSRRLRPLKIVNELTYLGSYHISNSVEKPKLHKIDTNSNPSKLSVSVPKSG